MPVYLLHPEHPGFPDPDRADPCGLVAVGGDLTPVRLMHAYARGIFPWYSAGEPILWWSPDPRLVLFPDELHVPRSLQRVMKRGEFEFRTDTAFSQVIRACAKAPRPQGPGTWLTPEMIRAYETLHRLGHAHSVEAWKDGDLAGGLYGVALGRAFFGESMFHRAPNASKACLVTLVELLRAKGFTLLDCQQTTPHMQRLGAREMPRAEFLKLLEAAVRGGEAPGRWVAEDGEGV
ncbi:MAG: leucyl/phenylalanyl-tRNA--protein transferase [Thermodesulfobacteriota bacterium]